MTTSYQDLRPCDWDWLLRPLHDAKDYGRPARPKVVAMRNVLERLTLGVDEVCIPALLEATILLADLHKVNWFVDPAWYKPEIANLPAARGRLYGKLLAALERSIEDWMAAGHYPESNNPELIRLTKAIWGEIEDSFTDHQTWQSRRRGFTLARAVTESFADSGPSGRAFNRLWQAFDAYTTYLLAGLEADSSEPHIQAAGLDYLDLVSFSVTTAARGLAPGERIQSEGTCFLLARAARVALEVAANTSTHRSEHVKKWSDAVAQLCEKVIVRPPRVQEELIRCAQDLWRYARIEPSLQVREAYVAPMDNMYLIAGHPRGSPRRKLGLACEIQTDHGFSAPGVIRNVCLDRFRGLGIESDGMAFYGMKPDRAGIWGETHDEAPRADGFQTRFVRIGPAEKSDVVPPTIDEFTLVTHFHDGAEAYELRLRCKVLRGWTRGNRVGLALLAPDQYVDRNDPAWAAWCRLVPGIGAPGRYDPANPADSIVEDGRGRV